MKRRKPPAFVSSIVDGPYKVERPGLLARFMRWAAWFVGVQALVMALGGCKKKGDESPDVPLFYRTHNVSLYRHRSGLCAFIYRVGEGRSGNAGIAHVPCPAPWFIDVDDMRRVEVP